MVGCRLSRSQDFMKAFTKLFRSGLLLLAAATTCHAQGAPDDFLDGLGLARLKSYSSHRASSQNRYVASNDDSKRILPGETLVMAEVSGAGMITHIWATIANNEFGWPRLLRLRVYYDGHKTPSVDTPLGDFFGVAHGSERNLNSIMIHDSSPVSYDSGDYHGCLDAALARAQQLLA